MTVMDDWPSVERSRGPMHPSRSCIDLDETADFFKAGIGWALRPIP
jgi:hypothetical protein